MKTRAERFVEDAYDNGGATVNAFGTTPKVGYMVSVFPAAEQVHPILTPKIVEDYFYTWNVELRDPNIYVGAWMVPEVGCYLDLSVREDDLSRAFMLGRDAKQLAIFDLKSGKEIRI